MATNPYVNKVQYGDTTVMDISDTTATEEDVLSGKTFYKASGARSLGTATIGGGTEAVELTQAAYDALSDADKENPNKIYFTNDNYEDNIKTKPIHWGGIIPGLFVTYIWTDGTNTYYSNSTTQKKLNGTTWEDITWTGMNDFYGNYIWTDGTNTYYSYYSTHKKLNGTTWEDVTWSGMSSFDGGNIWNDGTNVYYSYYSTQKKLNGTTWEDVTWSGYSSIVASDIWTDGTNVYFSYNTNQYKLNGTTWEAIAWNGISSFSGLYIWNDGTNIYYSNSSNQKKLNGTTWESVSWSGMTSFSGQNVWVDGTNVYFSDGSTDQKRLKGTTWEDMNWGGLSDLISFDKTYIWTDGTNMYYSLYQKQYKLNGTTWEPMTWSGYYNASGEYIWTDGTDIYFSEYSTQYKLNGTNWTSVTWTGMSSFCGDDIWTDGVNTYYSNSSTHKKLNGTTWEDVTWTGLTNFRGKKVWTDGTNTYYSDGSSQYKLNNTTWESVTWSGSGMSSFDRSFIWTDGKNTYFTNGSSKNRKLNGTTWETISADRDIRGSGVWSYRGKLYYSYGSQQYEVITVSPQGIYYKKNNYASPNEDLPMATPDVLGGIKVGNNLSIDANGVLSAVGGSSYELPTASANTLGGVKVGQNLSIDANGVLSASGGGEWGSITGTLSNQTDLKNTLDKKFDINSNAYNDIDDSNMVPFSATVSPKTRLVPFGTMRAKIISLSTDILKNTVGWVGKNMANLSLLELGKTGTGSSNPNYARLPIPCKPNTYYSFSRHASNPFSEVNLLYSDTNPPQGIVSFIRLDLTTVGIANPSGGSDAYMIIEFKKSSAVTKADVEDLKLLIREGTFFNDTYEAYHDTVEEELNNKSGWHTWENDETIYNEISLAVGNTTATFPDINDDYIYEPYIKCAKGVSPPKITDAKISVNNEYIITFTAVTSEQVGSPVSPATSECIIKLLKMKV